MEPDLNKDLTIPPINKNALTRPEILVEHLSVLIGVAFPLTRKTRTDGSNMRNLIAATLEKHPLPPPCARDSYTIIPPNLIALTKKTGIVTGIVLCPGEKLSEHFSFVSDTSYKCQRTIPMRFFDQFEGQAVYNP